MYIFFPQKSLTKHSRRNIGAEGGPPPFVPFGQVRTRSASFTVTFDLLDIDEVDLTVSSLCRNVLIMSRWTAVLWIRGRPCRARTPSNLLKTMTSLRNKESPLSQRSPRVKRCAVVLNEY